MKNDIIGSVASGKTTLARKISQKYKVPYYEKDNIVWMRTPKGDKKRTPEERDKFLCQNVKWVFEFNSMKSKLFTELKGYGDKCKIFTHSNEAMEFITQKFGG